MSMKKRILFVDDDAQVLQGLRRGLRSMKDEWQMEFASCGKEALDAMNSTPIDVLVTDMRMPGIDGVQVLVEALEHYPQTIRVVLSGHATPETLFRAASATHMILIKPCDTELIKARVQQMLRRNERLRDESLRSLVAKVAAVPSAPMLFLQVVKELEPENCSLEKIAQLVSMDMGMAASVLHFVNSGYFGGHSPISSPERAVHLLGVEAVRDLLITNRACSSQRTSDFRSFDATMVWSQGIGASVGARAIAYAHSENSVMADDAFAAGLFHDIGQVVLSRALGTFYDSVVERALSRGEPVWMAERDVIGSTHAEVGAHVLGLWGMPDAVVDAVAFHHSPSESGDSEFGALTALHLADAMEEQKLMEAQGWSRTVDRGYLRQLGLEGRWEHWMNAMSKDGIKL